MSKEKTDVDYTKFQEKLKLFEDALDSFSVLLNTKFKLLLGRKGKETKIELVFQPRNFLHVFGIKKLIDISEFIGNTSQTYYRKVLNSSVLRNLIVSSKYFNKIIPRVYSIIELKENFLDAKYNSHFKFVRKETYNFSLIDYNFLIISEYNNDKYHYFLRYTKNKKNRFECVLVSTFIENKKDYTIGQERMTLLKKVAVDILTGKETLIYINTSYKKQ